MEESADTFPFAFLQHGLQGIACYYYIIKSKTHSFVMLSANYILAQHNAADCILRFKRMFVDPKRIIPYKGNVQQNQQLPFHLIKFIQTIINSISCNFRRAKKKLKINTGPINIREFHGKIRFHFYIVLALTTEFSFNTGSGMNVLYNDTR